MTENADNWSLYIIEASDESLYTGITTDVARRVREHNEASVGARYTRVRRPVMLVYSESALDRSAAAKREAQIKKLPRSGKMALLASFAGD